MCVDEESTEVAINLRVADIEFLQEKANKSGRTLDEFIADIIESYVKD
jgi:predicted DNA binding CopG/RHH family protein